MPTFDHTSMKYSPEMAAFEAEQFEWGGETEWGETEVFNEMELMELAHELLAVTNEAKLYRFLGDLITREGQPIGGVVRSPIVQAVGGFLKGAAKRVLPLAGGAMGGYSGWPLLRGSWEACCQYRRKMPFILPIRQRPSLLQVGGVEALGEPAMERRQQLTRFCLLALLLPETTEAHSSPQRQRFHLLAASHIQSPLPPGFCLCLRRDRLLQEHDAPEARDFRFP